MNNIIYMVTCFSYIVYDDYNAICFVLCSIFILDCGLKDLSLSNAKLCSFSFPVVVYLKYLFLQI